MASPRSSYGAKSGGWRWTRSRLGLEQGEISCRSYSHAQLVAQANAMIGPWLVDQAKRQIAERTLKLRAIHEAL